MIFIGMMVVAALLSYLPQLVWGNGGDWRMPLRHGMAAAFLFTGIDHLINLDVRYLPMIPPYLSSYGRELVIASGIMEIVGAFALLLPSRWLNPRRLAWLRPTAGVALAMLLSVMVLANAHVASASASVDGMPFGHLYYTLRPLFQPFIILWALVCSEAIFSPRPYLRDIKS